jgi:site-specific recombinase XerD
MLLGHASIATTMEYVDSSFEQLRSEYEKLWRTDEDETTQTKD